MTDSTAAGFQREGEITFPTDTTAEESAADSQSEDTNQDEGTQSAEGDKNTQTEDKTPFHEHPRWKQREDEWNNRFNDQERRHQDDLAAIRTEFSGARKENAEATKIPAWFGGTQEQWDAYRADRDTELQQAADRAVDKLKAERGNEEKAVKDATAFLHSEIAAIQDDKTLNPSGGKVNAEELFRFVFDNQLIDAQGRWNYRAGWRFMNAGKTTTAPAPKPNTTEKKQVAAATTTAARGESSAPAIPTSNDFKGSKRPW